jgi:hypothetical protein
MMRKSIWISAFLFVAFAATNARAEEATLTFSGATTPYSLSASDVNLAAGGGSLTFDLTLSNSGTPYDQGPVTSDPGQSININDQLDWVLQSKPVPHNLTEYSFTLIDDTTGATDVIDDITTGIDPTTITPLLTFRETGTATLSATPEPASAILWLTGIGLMILTRKRIAHLFRPDPGTHGSLSPH